MGEEEKKPEEKKEEEKKPEEEPKKPAAAAEEKKEEEAKKPAAEEKKDEEKKTEEAKEEPKEPPPPPEEVILKVYMHCEGCARKVRKCLKGFPGVEDVQTDCKTGKVVVKGKAAAADPLKVLARIQKKSHRQVELVSPIPKPPSEEEKKKEENKENVKPEEKKEEPPVIIAIMKVHMHCEACAQEIQKRIQRMKGVQSVSADLKSSQVNVKGVFDPAKLVEYVYKRTGKHAVLVKTEPEKKEEEKGKEEKEEKKEEKGEQKDKGGEAGGEGGEKKEEAAEKPAGEEAAKPAEAEEAAKMETMELKRNEFYYYPPKYHMEYVYPPQIFSDENPNACSIM